MTGMTTAQVARRLGIKPATVYAYVSRGLLHSSRAAGGRGSRFDPAEVEQLAARVSRARPSAGAGPEVATELTLIQGGRLYYRGRDATALAASHSFEAVAGWLWSARLAEAKFAAPAELVATARAAGAALPGSVRLTDRLRVTTTVAATVDPVRFQIEPAAVASTGATLLAVMVDALPLRGDPGDDPRLAARLWPRLTAQPAHPAAIEALNAALVLLADHDLAASTVAARVAASSRAHPYAVVAAGLAAFDGPLHGVAPSQAYRLLAEAISTGDPRNVYSEWMRTGGRVVGFSPHIRHLYPDGDVRATALLDRLPRLAAPPPVPAAVAGVIAAASQRSPLPPNIDFALAALAHAGEMSADAAEAIFAIGRTAGWIAHALEEYGESGLRFRLAGSYCGQAPAESG